jgi:pyruvate dehydrogenase E1 component beta subunit
MIQEVIGVQRTPVLFFEPKSRYRAQGPVDLASAFRRTRSRVVRTGTERSPVGHGAMVNVLMQAAELAEQEGTSVGRSMTCAVSPIDYEPIPTSVRPGDWSWHPEAPGFLGKCPAEIAATITRAFYSLEAPVPG